MWHVKTLHTGGIANYVTAEHYSWRMAWIYMFSLNVWKGDSCWKTVVHSFFFFIWQYKVCKKTEQYYRTCNILQMAPPKTRSLPQLTKTPPGQAPAPSKTTLTQRLVNIRLEQIELWAACQAEGAEGKVKHSPNVAYLLQAKVAANLPISLALFTLDFHTTHTEN